MATVDGITPVRAQEIEDNSIVSAAIVSGELILTKGDGSVQNVGVVNNASALGAHETDISTHGVTEVVGRIEGQTLTNKVLTLPTIGSFLNAPHTHGDAAGGGPLAIGVANTPAAVVALTQFTLSDGDPARVMASLTVAPGSWLILAVCEGVTLASATVTRFSFDIAASQPTMNGKPIASSSDTTAMNGGRMVFGWLVNTVTAVVDFKIVKNGNGALVTNSTQGTLLAIRMG